MQQKVHTSCYVNFVAMTIINFFLNLNTIEFIINYNLYIQGVKAGSEQCAPPISRLPGITRPPCGKKFLKIWLPAQLFMLLKIASNFFLQFDP